MLFCRLLVVISIIYTVLILDVFANDHHNDDGRITNRKLQLRQQSDHHSHRRNLQTSGRIDQITLMNADLGIPIMNITTNTGTIINLATLSTTNLNILVTTTGGTVSSILFGYNNNTNFNSEKNPPYAFCGNTQGIYNTCTNLIVGIHTVTATPITNGIRGVTRTVTFTIENKPIGTNNNCKTPQFTEAVWTKNNPLYPISPIHEPQGSFIGNDLIITAGFYNNFVNVTNATYARDLTSNTSVWRRMDDMPLPVGITHMTHVVIGQKLYLCGGYLGGVPGPHSSVCFIYDHSKLPGRRQWSTFTRLPNGGTAGAGMIYDTIRNALYYAGGAQRPTTGSKVAIDYNNTWKYSFDNPTAGWVAVAPMPYTGNHLSSVTHTDATGKQRHFFMGGQVAEFEAQQNLADHVEFNATTEKWIRRTSMPFARSHASSSTRAIGCGFVIVSGSINSPTAQKLRTNDISYYDIPTNAWKHIGTVPATGATPIVDIDRQGYMHFVANKYCMRRKLAV